MLVWDVLPVDQRKDEDGGKSSRTTPPRPSSLGVVSDALGALNQFVAALGFNLFIWTARIAAMSAIYVPDAVTLCHELTTSMVAPSESHIRIAHNFARFRQCISNVEPSKFHILRYYHAVFGLPPGNVQAHVMRLNPEVYTLELVSEMARVAAGNAIDRMERIFVSRVTEGSNKELAFPSLTRLLELNASDIVFHELRNGTPPVLLKQLQVLEQWQKGFQGTPLAPIPLYWALIHTIEPSQATRRAKQFKLISQRLQLIRPVQSFDCGSVFSAALTLQIPLCSPPKRSKN